MKQNLFFLLMLCMYCKFSLAAIGPQYNWGTNFGGTSGNESVNAVKADAYGNVYVTGKFSGTNIDFNFGAGTTPLSSNGTSSDIFLAKYNAQGQLLWAKAMGGSGNDEGSAIAIDLSGNIWIAGTFYGTADLNPSGTTNNIYANNAADTDIFLAKYDTSGNYLWAGELNGSSLYDKVSAIAVSPANGNIFIIGTFTGNLDVSPGPLNVIINTPGSEDIFVANYSTSGAYQSNIKLGGTGTDRGTGIAIDAASNIYISGQITDAVDFDFGSGNSNTTAAGADAFVAKYSASYALQFVNVFGGALSFDMGYSVAVDNSGNVYTSGCFSGTADADPGSGTANVFTSNGGTTYGYVIKYNSAGAYQWVYTVRSTDALVPSMALDAAGDLYIASKGAGQFDADNSPGAYVINAGGAESPVLIKLTSAGALAWATALTCNDYGISNSVTVNSSGSVIVGGSFMGTADFDFSPNENLKTSLANDNDCFIAQYSSCNFPAAPALSDESICTGESIALTIPATGTGSWYTTATGNTYAGANGFTITPNSVITYYAQDSNACGSSPRTIKTITVNTPPVVQASADLSAICEGTSVTFTATGANTYSWNNSQTVSSFQITPTLADTLFTVIGTSNGCTDTASVSVQVNPLPVLALSASSDTICMGEQVAISTGSSPSNTFIWSTGSNAASLLESPSVTTSYSVTVSTSFGCSATGSVSVEVNSVDNTVTSNANVLTAQATSATYQWLDCATNSPIAGATNQTFTATENGNYKVLVTGSNGCSATSSCISVVGLSVNEAVTVGFSIYPNPAHKTFTVTLNPEFRKASPVISMYNSTGEKIISQSLNDISNTIDCTGFSAGIYMVCVSNGKQQLTQRIVIE